MARSKSSTRWLDEHFEDRYVRQSQQDGYRSRASFKLLEIDSKDRLIMPGMRVVDLGAAPGGWSQVAAEKVGDSGIVVASDILPMEPIVGVDFVQGDFTESSVLEKILQKVGGEPVDLVISDMAPNMTGTLAIDQPNAMHLAELALDLATRILGEGGSFLTKVFQGEGYPDYRAQVKAQFRTIFTRKPDSSRARSREIFLLARRFCKSARPWF